MEEVLHTGEARSHQDLMVEKAGELFREQGYLGFSVEDAANLDAMLNPGSIEFFDLAAEFSKG